MLNVEILPVRKRLFIGLLGFSLVGVGLLLSGIWYLATSDTRKNDAHTIYLNSPIFKL
jgi:hypothetical protein